MKKPKLGAALLISDWFLTAGGIDGSTNKEYRELGELLDKDVKAITDTLEQYYDVVFPGLLTTEENALAAAEEFHKQTVDAIIIVHVMWSDDFPLIRVLQECGCCHKMLWYYNAFTRLPARMEMNDSFRGSGSVGMLQGSAPMKKMGVDFEFLSGTPDDEGVHRKLSDYAAALSLIKSLKVCKVGEIGPRCESMTGTFTDEFKLLSTLGVKICPISSYRLYEEAGKVDDDKVIELTEELKSRYRVEGVDDESLFAAARATLGVEKLVIDEDLDIVSMEDLDPEMHKLLKTRPCLWTDELTRRGTGVVMERDTVSGVGQYICSFLSGGPAMYGEIFTCDLTENALVYGHAGMHNTDLIGGDAYLTKDMEFYQTDETCGAWLKFTPKAGRVTMVSLFSDVEGYRMTTFMGEATDIDKMPNGFIHSYIKCDMEMSYLYENLARLGVTQHFSMCYGDIRNKLRVFCKLSGTTYIDL